MTDHVDAGTSLVGAVVELQIAQQMYEETGHDGRRVHTVAQIAWFRTRPEHEGACRRRP